MSFTVIALPVIGAFIGWVTNYIAVKMLFHPRKEIRILFVPVQGVFPKRQKAFAQKLGQIVSAELFSVADVKAHLKESANSPQMTALVKKTVERTIQERLPAIVPMLSMFLTPELLATVSEAFVLEAKPMIGSLVDELSAGIERDMDVHKIVEDKVAAFSSDKLEEILFAIMKKEFKFIELVGGVLGFLIGVAQVVMVELEPMINLY